MKKKKVIRDRIGDLVEQTGATTITAKELENLGKRFRSIDTGEMIIMQKESMVRADKVILF